MNLETKAVENLSLVAECVRTGRHCTAATGRAYYAVFQRLKSLLLRERAAIYEDKDLAHGAIKATVVAHLVKTRPNLRALDIAAKLAPLDQLYAARRDADYRDGPQIQRAGLEGYRVLAAALVAYIDSV